MYVPLHCVALRTVRYSDRSSILTAYSLECGRISLAVPASNGRSAARYRALTMPLSVFECVAYIKQGREIHNFKDLKVDASTLASDYGNPVRRMLSFFLADFFYSVIKEPALDEAMYNLMSGVAMMISNVSDRELPNLHIAAMLSTARIMGIEPDASTVEPGSYFDMTEGIWKKDLTAFNKESISGAEAETVVRLLRMTFENQRYYKFSRKQRNEIVSGILKYFSLHGFGRMELTSLDVLQELFD